VFKKKFFRLPLKNKKTADSGEVNAAETDRAAILRQQNELDKKLVYSLNKTKIPSPKQLKYLHQVLDSKQRLLVRALSGLIILCLAIIGVNFYLRNFLPVPIVGGDYTEGLIGAPQYINPILCQTNDVDSDLARLVFSGLLKYDANLQLVPDLAESWTASDDQKNYTFILKEGLKWHDGEPLTADDVVFTFQSIKDQDFKSPLLISLRGVEVQKVDDRTVKFVLPEAYSAFIEVLTVGLLPEHIWGEIPPLNANLSEYNLKPVGNGPWKFKSLAKDRLGNIKSYTLEPYAGYLGPKPYLEKITFKFYPDFETAVGALKSNLIEGISYLPKDQKSELKGQKNIHFYSFDLPQYTAIFFNQKQNEILKEKSVRTALAMSIDKNNILSGALQMEGKIIDSPLLPVAVTLSDDKQSHFDIAAANKLLEDAGWKQISTQDYQALVLAEREKAEAAAKKDEPAAAAGETASGTPAVAPAETPVPTSTQPFYRQKKDKILSVTLTTVNQSENAKAAELIKQAWENIGVKVDLQVVEGGKISRDIIKPRNYQILLFGIIVGANADPYPFWHSSQIEDPGLNLALLANREVDKILEEARKTANPQDEAPNYQRFAEILASEIPAIFIYNPTYTYVVDKKIKGLGVSRIIVPADRFINLEDWYVKTKRIWQGTKSF